MNKENLEKLSLLAIPILVIAFIVFFPGLNVTNQRGNFETNLKESNFEIEKKDSIKKLEHKTMREGSSDRLVQKGDEIVVNYKGWISKTGLVFDQSIEEGNNPFTFTVGSGVITGWSEGVIGMKKGEIRRLYIPSAKGYGKEGSGTDIPPNADLIFDVELLYFAN